MLIRFILNLLTTILLIAVCEQDTKSTLVHESFKSGNSYVENGNLDKAIADYDREPVIANI